MQMRWTLNGREIPPGGLAGALKASILEAGGQRIAANLDGLVCPIHGSTPQVERGAESAYSVRSCCESLDAKVRERFELSPASAEKPEQTPMKETSDAAESISRAPRAFISHTSSDKERFVRPFCTLLQERGIEPWLDERELLPGDNLVDKIFNDGISSSDVFIVVLSENSIERRWVKEELSVAVVQKIAGVVKAIIPIILDDVSPPPVLSATVWEIVTDLSTMERHADRVAAAIFGQMPAPAAPAPAYAGLPVHRLAGLEPDDERIFVIACEQLLTNTFAYPIVDLRVVEGTARSIGMSEDRIYECVHVLEQHAYFNDVGHYLGDKRPSNARVSAFAFERFLEAYRPDKYRKEKQRVLSSIINEHMNESRQIASALEIHEYIVEHIVEGLEASGDIMASHHMQGISIRTKPSLARKLRQMGG